MERTFTGDYEQFNSLLKQNNLTEARHLIEDMHVHYHGEAFKHILIHHHFISLCVAEKRFLPIFGHLLAGYLFAAPASLIQKYSGKALPRFKE